MEENTSNFERYNSVNDFITEFNCKQPDYTAAFDKIVEYDFSWDIENTEGNQEYVDKTGMERYFHYKLWHIHQGKTETKDKKANIVYKNKKYYNTFKVAYGLEDDIYDKYSLIDPDTQSMLLGEIYSTLWDNKLPDGNTGSGDTMNSMQIPLQNLCGVYSIRKCYCKYIACQYQESVFNNKHVKLLAERYHTIGNFVLVPKFFNPYRADKRTRTNDYWDLALNLLKNKNKDWRYCFKGKNNYTLSKQVEWNKKYFTQYINTFFLWDYVFPNTDNEPTEYNIQSLFSNNLTVSDIPDSHTLWLENDSKGKIAPQSHDESMAFFKNTNRAIARRSVFMITMLVIANDNSDNGLYDTLCKEIFLTDTIYNGYGEVFNQINNILDEKSDYKAKYKQLIDAAQNKIKSII